MRHIHIDHLEPLGKGDYQFMKIVGNILLQIPTFKQNTSNFEYLEALNAISSYIFKIKTLGYIQKIQSFNTTKLSKPQDFSFSLSNK